MVNMTTTAAFVVIQRRYCCCWVLFLGLGLCFPQLGASLSTSTPPSSPYPSVLSNNQKALDQGPRFPKTWVPLGSVLELNPDRPTPVTFLNQNYVIFKGTRDDDWVVMDDACPHRLAPLSEGRIDRRRRESGSGTKEEERFLECSYHGWSFDTTGRCHSIPQVTQQVQDKVVANNPACHVKSYSTMVVKGLVWAWLWKEDAVEEALKDPTITPHALVEPVQTVVATYTRELPYGWDTLQENLLDPAHIPFAHHNLQGTRDDAIPINMTITKAVSKSGYQFEHTDRTMNKMRKSWGDFRAPFVINYGGVFGPAGQPDLPSTDAKETKDGGADGDDTNKSPSYFNLTVVNIPTRPGWSRTFILTAIPAERAAAGDRNKSPSWRNRLVAIFPKWVVHILSNKFLDSDLAFLHHQEQEREKRGGDTGFGSSFLVGSEDAAGSDDIHNKQQLYFTPAPADRSVNAFRQWKNQYASVLLPLPPAIQNRAVLFDRYTQHTDHCVICSKALQQLRTVRTRLVGVAAGGGILTALAASRSTGFTVFGCILVAASVAVVGLMNQLEQGFLKGEFRHYENE